MTRRFLIVALAVLALAGIATNVALTSASGTAHRDSVRLSLTASPSKPVLGPIAVVAEEESQLEFVARVDTGAEVCSIHAEELSVTGGSDAMQENVGKKIRFRIANRNGESMWLERPIVKVSFVKNSNGAEWRYQVFMTLACEGTHKQVLVSLNDRSQMNYAMLLGRNLLGGEFLVDVGIEKGPTRFYAAPRIPSPRNGEKVTEND